MHDLIVRGGRVVDGTGEPARTADVAISDGVVTEVGHLRGEAAAVVVDADGALVTPGFVDPHTHFDGQVTWDPLLTPSCWHGVTTVVFGNCGVGFAPAHPDKHDWLIGLMEGVEDIPGAALSDGIQWGWESFPEYLDAVDAAAKTMDVGALVPHGSVRAYVMGERGARNEPATPDDIDAMAEIVRDGMRRRCARLLDESHDRAHGDRRRAGSRHVRGRGRAVRYRSCARRARHRRVRARAGRRARRGPCRARREMAWMRKLGATIDRPVSFVLTQNDHDPTSWQEMLEQCAAAAREGASVRPQVHGRSVTLLLGLANFHPFAYCPSWGPLGLLSVPQRVAEMRKPELRRAVARGDHQGRPDDDAVHRSRARLPAR